MDMLTLRLETREGGRVRWVPTEANGDPESPYCSDGTISRFDGLRVMVKFDAAVDVDVPKREAVVALREPARNDCTPWFLAATDGSPVREGRYQVRFCLGWHEVFCVWRKGAWWVGGGGLDKPARVNLERWPGFHWRGRREPPNEKGNRPA